MTQRKAKPLTYEIDVPNKGKRFRELIVYIASRCEGDDTFGATKLNKIMWFADFVSYSRRGVPITGEKYQRLERGPAPVKMLPIQQELKAAQDIVIKDKNFRGKTQRRVIALREADLSLFSGTDIAIVDEVIEACHGLTAAAISEASHGSAWKTRYDNDLIPYEAAFLSDEPITPADISRTEELGRQLGWDAIKSEAKRAHA